MHISISVVPHYKRRVISRLEQYQQTLYLGSHKQLFTDINNIKQYELTYHISYSRYKDSAVGYYYHNFHIDTGTVRILFENSINITKYMRTSDAFKFWVALGFPYYYLLGLQNYNLHRDISYMKIRYALYRTKN
jgi:hypothetical protein